MSDRFFCFGLIGAFWALSLLGGTVARAAPPAEFDADLLYGLLLAEVALQREQPLTAWQQYLDAARRTADARLAEQAVRAALAAKAQAPAEQAAALWLELAPDSAKAHRLAAYVALEGADPAAALALLRRVVALAATPAQGYREVAGLLARLPEPRQRFETLRALLGKTLDPDAAMTLAALAVDAGLLDEARGYAEQAEHARPDWNQPQRFLARLALGAGQPEVARARLERYFAQGHEDTELRLLHAQLLIEAEDFAAARQTLEAVLRKRPNFSNALFAAAALSLQLADTDAARAYLLRLRATGERLPEALFMLGQTEEMAGNLPAALDWYDQVRGERMFDAQVRSASLHAQQGNLRQARALLQGLRERLPEERVQLYLIEAELLREQGEKPLALELYGQALTQYPDNTELLYARALLAAQLDNIALLEQDLRRVLTFDPDHADALNALGYTLADQTERLAEAYRLIQRALQLQPEEPAILDSMGWVLYRMGQPAQAEPYLRQALDRLSDGEIAAHLGEVLWALGRRDEARALWRQALSAYPQHEYLRRVVERHDAALLTTAP